MARMLSHIASVIRGSVGGMTYTANQWHQIICRARTSPVQPQTNYQTLLRSSFTSAAAYWANGLSPGQRLLWQAYAETCPYEGPLGNYFITGRNMYIANHGTVTYLTARGLTFNIVGNSAPVTPGFLSITINPPGALTAVGTGFSILVENFSGERIVVYAQRSIAFGPARLRYKGPWLPVTLQGIDLDDEDSDTLEFPDLVDESAYFVVIRAMSYASPIRHSNQYILRAVAAVTAA